MVKKNIINAIKNLEYLTRRYRKVNSPVFWVFLDTERIDNYENFILLLPNKSNIGIIFRSKALESKYHKAKKLLKICKKKKLLFIIADNSKLALALGAYGVHLSKKTRFVKKYNNLRYFCSVHGFNDKRRINNLRAELVFIAPVFKTTSSKLKKPLGLNFLGILAKYINCKYAVIGGISFDNARLLRGRNVSSFGGLTYITKFLDK